MHSLILGKGGELLQALRKYVTCLLALLAVLTEALSIGAGVPLKPPVILHVHPLSRMLPTVGVRRLDTELDRAAVVSGLL